MSGWRVGSDTGGTYADLVAIRGAEIDLLAHGRPWPRMPSSPALASHGIAHDSRLPRGAPAGSAQPSVNREHEARAHRIIDEELPYVFVVHSAESLREPPEFERTSTTVINATLIPVVTAYLSALERQLEEAGFGGRYGHALGWRAYDGPVRGPLPGPPRDVWTRGRRQGRGEHGRRRAGCLREPSLRGHRGRARRQGPHRDRARAP